MLKIYKTVVRFFVAIRDRVKDLILKYRIISLAGAGFLGYKFAGEACDIVPFCIPGGNNNVLESSITILALSIPTLFILWLFRTHDTQENINNSTFFECARLLATEDSPGEDEKDRIENSLPKKIALEQLAYLKRETGFDKKRIDLLTNNLSLNNKEFSCAQLCDINLSAAKLIKTSFNGADLSNADLSNADLSNAELIYANLKGADLVSAYLQKACLMHANLEGADLRGIVERDNLSESDLMGANPGSMNQGADLCDADLMGANLKGAKLGSAIYNDNTNFNDTVFENKEARDNAGMRYRTK